MAAKTKKPTKPAEKPKSKPDAGRRQIWTGVLIGLLIAAVAWLGIKLFYQPEETIKSNTVEIQLRDIGELATQCAYFKNLQVIQDSREIFGITRPGTQKKYIYTYDGTVKAGIDFSKVAAQTDEEAGLITLTAPAPYILDVIVDPNSFELYHETENMFNTLKIADRAEAMKQLDETIRRTAVEKGILEEARRNAERLLYAFASNIAGAEYTIKLVWEEEDNGQSAVENP